MATISSYTVAVNISIAGCDCEQEARVEYLHTRAFGPIVERGSGIPVSPPEPEMAEIQRVMVLGGEADLQGKRKEYDILHLLTDEQVQAIENEILEQGQ